MIVVIGVSLRRHKHKHFRHSVRKFLIANKPTGVKNICTQYSYNK